MGRDGRGRVCQRDGTVGARLVDGTGRWGDISSTGRDGTGPRVHFDDVFLLSHPVPSRSVVTVSSVPSINQENCAK